jgi:hypothetical protein
MPLRAPELTCVPGGGVKDAAWESSGDRNSKQMIKGTYCSEVILDMSLDGKKKWVVPFPPTSNAEE